MRFRNSVLLLIENFKNVYRILIYKLIILVIGSALTSAFLVPGLIGIFVTSTFVIISTWKWIRWSWLLLFPMRK